MESILTVTGLALTTAFSFCVALLFGWATLAGLLRLLPAAAPDLQIIKPALVTVAAGRSRRPRVVLTQAKSCSRRMYTVRVA
jgi:hypothetical protein